MIQVLTTGAAFGAYYLRVALEGARCDLGAFFVSIGAALLGVVGGMVFVLFGPSASTLDVSTKRARGLHFGITSLSWIFIWTSAVITTGGGDDRYLYYFRDQLFVFHKPDALWHWNDSSILLFIVGTLICSYLALLAAERHSKWWLFSTLPAIGLSGWNLYIFDAFASGCG